MKFTVYSKNGCPYCEQIKQIMEMKGFDHVVYTLNENFTREEFYSQFGNGSTFPQVVMGDQNLGGCVNTVKYLRENNMI